MLKFTLSRDARSRESRRGAGASHATLSGLRHFTDINGRCAAGTTFTSPTAVITRVLVASTRRADLVAAWQVVREAFEAQDVPSMLLGVTILRCHDLLVEFEAVAAAVDRSDLARSLGREPIDNEGSTSAGPGCDARNHNLPRSSSWHGSSRETANHQPPKAGSRMAATRTI